MCDGLFRTAAKSPGVLERAGRAAVENFEVELSRGGAWTRLWVVRIGRTWNT